MSQDQAKAWNPTKYEVIKMKIGDFKYKLYMLYHKVFWRTLHFLRLGTIYSKVSCRFCFYSEFLDGRCHWCGKKH